MNLETNPVQNIPVVETNPIQNIPVVETPKPIGIAEMSDGADNPVSAFITMGIVAMINLLILAKSLFKEYNPNNSSFAFWEMLKQSTILYLLSQTFGLIIISRLFAGLKKYEFFALPLLLAFSSYMISVTMGYAQLSTCNNTDDISIKRVGFEDKSFDNKKSNVSSRKYAVWLLAFLPAFAMIIMYLLCFTFEFMNTPFYQLLGGGKSSWGYFMSIGFWSACAVWPTVSIMYFTLSRFACSTDSSINIKDVSNILNEEDE